MAFHYAYRITNLSEQKHYYGSRTSKIAPCEDLGKEYFSSSTDSDFKRDQRANSENYKYKVIKIYKTRKGAMNMEIKLHNKLSVGSNSSFYNKAAQTSTSFDRTGIPHSEEARKKIGAGGKGKGMFGKTVPLERRMRVSRALMGHTQTEETRLKKSKSHKGKILSPITRQKISESRKGKPRPTQECPHCGKVGSVGNMSRWHFDNCKKKENK